MMNKYDKQEFTNAAMMMGVFGQYMVLITEMFEIFLGWFSLPLEILLRRDFGERYLSIIRFFIAATFVGLSRSVITLISFATGYNTFAYLVGWVVFGLFIFHRWQIRKRKKSGTPWHSMSFGVSHLDGLVRWVARENIPMLSPMVRNWDDYTLYRWVEPGLCLMVSWFFWYFDPGLSVYLLISTAALFLKNQIDYNQQYNQYLDQIDAQIEAEYMQMAIDGLPKTQTGGFSIVTAPNPIDFGHEASPSRSETIRSVSVGQAMYDDDQSDSIDDVVNQVLNG